MSSSAGTKPNFDWVLDEKVSKIIRRMARQLSRSPGFSRSDEPDIEQELRAHLLEKASKFNAARSKVTTFAKRLIENKAASIARKVDAGMRSYRRNSISLNVSIANAEDGISELADLLDSSAGRRHTGQRTRSSAELANLRLDVADANSNLPRTLKTLAALLSHLPQYAAGQVLGMSRKQTARHVTALRDVYESRGLAG
jgi:hypothetical protein